MDGWVISHKRRGIMPFLAEIAHPPLLIRESQGEMIS
jgi:hypothetical protein